MGFFIIFLLSLSFLFTSNGHSDFDPTLVTQLSWKPRVFLSKGFLSDQECDHLISLARDKLEVSTVADNESGKSVLSEVRTSSGMFINKYQEDEIVTRIEQRIAAWTFLPAENGEPIQVLRYEIGQKYEPHTDYFIDEVNKERGGHRVITVLMYLSNVEEGGETIFPYAEGAHAQKKNESGSDCAKQGLAVKPEKGDAVLFFSLHIDGTPDPSSTHGSCPVIRGEKWSATKWIHVRSFDNPTKWRESGDECIDEHSKCSQWAAIGECKKNPKYMVGSKGRPGFCQKSCKACTHEFHFVLDMNMSGKSQ